MNQNKDHRTKYRILPGGEKILCDLSIPYEAMVYLEREEQKDLELLTQLLNPSDTFVDCGANIGIWSLVTASRVNSSGKVYAFEPNPSTFQKLSYNVSLSRFKNNIKLIPQAVGNEQKTVLFECNPAHNISCISDKATQDTQEVFLTTIDQVLDGTTINAIKIDVEGLELDCLQGGLQTLIKYKPWLCVEFNTLLAQVSQLSEWNVHNYLKYLGYRCRCFHNALDKSQETILPDN